MNHGSDPKRTKQLLQAAEQFSELETGLPGRVCASTLLTNDTQGRRSAARLRAFPLIKDPAVAAEHLTSAAY